MALNSNRFPGRQVARDYRSDRPVRRYPVPDNDNKPGWRPPRKPLPLIPANDNRPVPKVGEWSFSRPPRIPGYLKWLRRILRLHPVIGIGLTLWELYDLYQWYMSAGPAAGQYWFCREATRPGRGYRWGNKHTDPNRPAEVCTTSTGWAEPTGTWAPQHPWYIEFEQWINSLTGGRRKHPIQAWRYDVDPGFDGPGFPPQSKPTPWVEPWLPPNVRPDPWIEPFVEPYRPLPPTPPRPRYRRRRDDRDRPTLPEDRVSDEPTFEPRPDWRTEPYPRKPHKRERERKVRLKDMPNKRLRRVFGWLLSAASEGGDFLDIMYGALPKELQKDDANMSEKFETVFKNLDKVDFDKFVSDLWQNEVSDRYFGKGFEDMSDALESFGLELPSLKL